MMSLYDPYTDGDLKRQKQGYTAVCLIGLPKGDLARWQKYTVFCPKNQVQPVRVHVDSKQSLPQPNKTLFVCRAKSMPKTLTG
jgi:hypothetical protein